MGSVVISTMMGRLPDGDAVAVLDAFSLVGEKSCGNATGVAITVLVPPLPVK